MNYEQTAYTIEDTLELFDAPAVCVECCIGATVTTFKLDPRFRIVDNEQIVNSRPTKLGKIQALAPDLQLALKAKSIRIEPLNGSGLIGVEIPNENRKPVLLKDLIKRAKPTGLELVLGVENSGKIVKVNLGDLPHALIGGSTGSGKSVCLNSIISTLLLNNTPEDLRLILIDPKRVELAAYNSVPHLFIPVVTDPVEAVSALDIAVKEMDRRYKLLQEAGVRNISAYNNKSKEKLPFLVVCVDEMSDLMIQSSKEVEDGCKRIAQLGRASGTHMIICTQRPSVDVLNGTIKANFPERVAFATSSSVDSRVIIDSSGAEQLLGLGDGIYSSGGKQTRFQGAFISDEEIDTIVNWRKRDTTKNSS